MPEKCFGEWLENEWSSVDSLSSKEWYSQLANLKTEAYQESWLAETLTDTHGNGTDLIFSTANAGGKNARTSSSQRSSIHFFVHNVCCNLPKICHCGKYFARWLLWSLFWGEFSRKKCHSWGHVVSKISTPFFQGNNLTVGDATFLMSPFGCIVTLNGNCGSKYFNVKRQSS